MSYCLAALALFLGLCFLWHARAVRSQWRRIRRMVEAIASGGRPASFILHGEKPARDIGLGLERLADRLATLETRIAREKFNLQALLASLAEGVMVVDLSRKIRFSNASFLRLFGLREEPPAGQSALTVLRDAAIEKVLREVLENGEPRSCEIALEAAPARQLAMSATPVRDAGGRLDGVAVTFSDMSRLRRLEELRRDFVANVSHELRTPLSIFQGYVELLRDNSALPREEIAKTVAVLERHSRRLNLLLEDLLCLARLETPDARLRLEAVDIRAFFRELEADWRLKCQAAQVAFCVEIADGFPALQADRFRLAQVFHNLLDNALKYTPPGGVVTLQALRCEENAASAEFRVSDTGEGIPAADLPHIFERFYRVDKARSPDSGGTGLGLAIVKHIAQLHGGEIRAQSAPGCGSVFILRLPAAGLGAVDG